MNNNHYVLDYSVGYPNKYIKTKFGIVHFKLCTDKGEGALVTDKRRAKILTDVYYGKYATKCHEISSLLGVNCDYITTAFINSSLLGYKFLHTFAEEGDYVLDFARNVKVLRNEYYSLVNPDIVSKIIGERLVYDMIDVSHNYPPMTLKEFFVGYNQLVKR